MRLNQVPASIIVVAEKRNINDMGSAITLDRCCHGDSAIDLLRDASLRVDVRAAKIEVAREAVWVTVCSRSWGQLDQAALAQL